MTAHLSRRALLGAAAILPLAAACGRSAPPAPPAAPRTDRATAELADLEARFVGRLGVYALDTGNGATVGHRADELFPMCSTFKVLAASAILRLRTQQPGLLDRVVHYTQAQMVDGSPISSTHLADGMTVAAMCAAAIQYSDNSAANQLLDILGGPRGVTAFVRTLGDPLTRLDRYETDLNIVPPGEVRDTSTPEWMGKNLRALALGDALDPAGRDQLVEWMVGNTTGATRIRAGLPNGWRVGDKTGGGARNEINDIAVCWPPNRAPLVIAVYTAPTDPNAKGDGKVLADAASIVVRALTP
ncbi:class A beta-lactamase [Pseudonocardia spinosispora]|uniref:class A beta-lactamase n=1 Tax=Pseudonocardia spinosispora TaxID=103441 RepID=UPI000420E0F8|nr:class A beta-lactamase [Pseudonocardia spinosispora]